jgi:hypothetical protein
MYDLSYTLTDEGKENAVAQMQYRLESGNYAEVMLAPGAYLIWDAYDRQPYINISPDSPFHAGEPDGSAVMLADYGPLGESLSLSAESVVVEVTQCDEVVFENDGTMDNGCMIFHAFLRRRTQSRPGPAVLA